MKLDSLDSLQKIASKERWFACCTDGQLKIVTNDDTHKLNESLLVSINRVADAKHVQRCDYTY